MDIKKAFESSLITEKEDEEFRRQLRKAEELSKLENTRKSPKKDPPTKSVKNALESNIVTEKEDEEFRQLSKYDLKKANRLF